MRWPRPLWLLGAAAGATATLFGVYGLVQLGRHRRRHNRVQQAVANRAGSSGGDAVANTAPSSSTSTAVAISQRQTRIVVRPLSTQTRVMIEMALAIIALLLVLLATTSDNMMALAAVLMWFVLRMAASTAPLSSGFDLIDNGAHEQKHDEDEDEEKQGEDERTAMVKREPDMDGDPYSLDPIWFLGRVPSSMSDIEWLPTIESVLEFSWEFTTQHFFSLLGSERASDVDVGDLEVREAHEGFRLCRRILKYPVRVPMMLRSLVGGIDNIEADERSLIDSSSRLLRVCTRNVNCRSITRLFEEVEIREHSSNPNWSVMQRRSCIRIEVSGALRSAVGHAIRSGLARKSRDITEAFVEHLQEAFNASPATASPPREA